MDTFRMSLLFSVILLAGCINKNEERNVTKTEINGVVQKGPFINGSSIEIYELKNDLSPSGRAFSSQILDNSGTFQLKNIALESPYIQLKANGYYFNELLNQNSNSPITLFALSDIKDKSKVNINLLSHLEKGRVEYLISAGTTFPAAKKQAEQEIVNIFSIHKSDISDFDMLDISEKGENNAILLAISLIAQGYRTESELSDLLAAIITDIREDGILNSASTGSLLINDARLLNLPQIKANIEHRYSSLGMNVTIPDFEKYIKIFIDSTTYQITNKIEYPEFSNYGENVLFSDKTHFNSDSGKDTNRLDFNSGLSLAANLPKGTSLTIIIKGGLWEYRAMPNGPINWTMSAYNSEEQTFTATESGKSCDLNIKFYPGTHTIGYYENGAVAPTRVKTFTN